MQKPTSRNAKLFNFLECRNYIEQKYNIDLHYYETKKNGKVEDFMEFMDCNDGSLYVMWNDDQEHWSHEVINLFFTEFAEEGEDELEFEVYW